MQARVFLSLSYVDAEFVADVRKRLPYGLAYFYEESFDNGEQILSAMRKRIQGAQLFVLFASPTGLTSNAVRFEINEAEKRIAFDPSARLLIFPTAPEVTFRDLPMWMQSHWMAGAGYSSADIARYITTYLLAPNEGLAPAAVKVVGRGGTLDKLEQIAGDHLQRTRTMPRIYIFAGFSGIGRRTFASYYMRTALASEASLPFGPTITLAPQADFIDLYRELRDAIDDKIAPDVLRADQLEFGKLSVVEQAQEVARLLGHFADLKQAVTLISTSGFAEDNGDPKLWLTTLLETLPPALTLFIVTNRQLPLEFVESIGSAVQLRIDELTDRDIKTLMIYTADRLKVADFQVPEELVSAIGGHADVANAAVRLAGQKGLHALTHNPGYLYNVQKTILGEAIEPGALSDVDRSILDTLCWVPSLGGDLVQEIVCKVSGLDVGAFIEANQRLVLGCLVIAQGYTLAISPAIRQLYRRGNVTPPETLKVIADTLSRHWTEAESQGKFREDLFEAFVFMHAFKGEKLPEQLRDLLSPGTLESVVSETYARGKNEDNPELLEQAVTWGSIAETMDMSDAVREEILAMVARAQIRMAQWESAQETINRIKAKGYQSYHFLQGHFYRRRGYYPKAIAALEEAVDVRKFKRSAVHELAIAYSKLHREEKLDGLLNKHKHLIEDSAMFMDFSIGQKLKHGELDGLAGMIRRMRTMAEDEGRADRREAQLLIRQGRVKDAKNFLTQVLDRSRTNRFHLRSLRSIAASKDKDFALAKRDIDFVRSLRGREDVASRLEAEYLLETGDTVSAEKALRKVEPFNAEDNRQLARILDARAESTSSLTERAALRREVDLIRAQYGNGVSLEF